MAKILIVDDSEVQLSTLKSLVEGEGHQVVTARDGQAGLVAASNEVPDLILLDIVMPEMSGFQVIRKLRREDSTKNIPIIFVTTKNQETDRIWGLRQGAKAFLSKPVDRQQLVSTISDVLAA